MVYQFTIYPIECVYKVLYLALSEVTGDNYGLALIFLSLITYALMQPLMSYAEKFQDNEKNIQTVMTPQIAMIKEKYYKCSGEVIANYLIESAQQLKHQD